MTAPAQAIATRSGRWYERHGERYLSVTNALGVLSKYLVPWAAETATRWMWENMDTLVKLPLDDVVLLARSKPFQKRDEAALRGSDVHAAIAGYASGREVELLPQVRPYIEQFERWRADYAPDFLETECTVYHKDPDGNYAGTLDAIVRIGEQALLVDFKTGDKPDSRPYPEVALQLAAYRHAQFIGREDGTDDPMPNVDACAVLHLRPNGYTFAEVRAGEDEYWAFLNAVQLWVWREGRGKEAIGGPYPRWRVVA